MINGLFKEISEEEMMSVNGGCGEIFMEIFQVREVKVGK